MSSFRGIDIRHGAIGIVPEPLDGYVVANDFPVYVFGGDVDLRYANYVFQTKDFREQCIAGSAGSTNRKKMRRESFLKLEIPVPSLSMQTRIADQADRLLADVVPIDAKAGQTVQHAELSIQRLLDRLAPWPESGASYLLTKVLPACLLKHQGTTVLQVHLILHVLVISMR